MLPRDWGLIADVFIFLIVLLHLPLPLIVLLLRCSSFVLQALVTRRVRRALVPGRGGAPGLAALRSVCNSFSLLCISPSLHSAECVDASAHRSLTISAQQTSAVATRLAALHRLSTHVSGRAMPHSPCSKYELPADTMALIASVCVFNSPAADLPHRHLAARPAHLPGGRAGWVRLGQWDLSCF